jgi:pimeloyl-ACP methyl ester carboxylesterase
MALPQSRADGLLPDGVWRAELSEFLERFCSPPSRERFERPVETIYQYAIDRGASRLLFGGSFVSTSSQPRDIDVVLIFANRSQIPRRAERLLVEHVMLDIYYCAEQDKDVVNSFIVLFGESRSGKSAGVVEIEVRENQAGTPSAAFEQPPSDVLELVRMLYIDRYSSDMNGHKALITVHGLKSYGDWYGEVVEAASSSGWLVAPFFYGYNWFGTLTCGRSRSSVVDRFRRYVSDVVSRYHCDVSIIAHSFGTYVVVRYLLGFDNPPIAFDTLILANAVVSEDLDTSRLRRKVSQVVNEVAPNDNVLRFVKTASLYRDPLLGQAGRIGFLGVNEPFVLQPRGEIYTHSNVIRRDVVVSRWMPRLEANVGRWRRENELHEFQRFVDDPQGY